jgi:hypothetical protein
MAKWIRQVWGWVKPGRKSDGYVLENSVYTSQITQTTSEQVYRVLRLVRALDHLRAHPIIYMTTWRREILDGRRVLATPSPKVWDWACQTMGNPVHLLSCHVTKHLHPWMMCEHLKFFCSVDCSPGTTPFVLLVLSICLLNHSFDFDSLHLVTCNNDHS